MVTGVDSTFSAILTMLDNLRVNASALRAQNANPLLMLVRSNGVSNMANAILTATATAMAKTLVAVCHLQLNSWSVSTVMIATANACNF